jgi:hypothetical protein
MMAYQDGWTWWQSDSVPGGLLAFRAENKRRQLCLLYVGLLAYTLNWSLLEVQNFYHTVTQHRGLLSDLNDFLTENSHLSWNAASFLASEAALDARSLGRVWVHEFWSKSSGLIVCIAIFPMPPPCPSFDNSFVLQSLLHRFTLHPSVLHRMTFAPCRMHTPPFTTKFVQSLFCTSSLCTLPHA